METQSGEETSTSQAVQEPSSQTLQRSGVVVNVKTLLEAGAHYGHQVERWNPKMLPFIYGERNGVHILNLDTTIKAWEKAVKYIYDRTSLGGNVLFVGTKLQARDIVKEAATRCGQYYCTSRWLGGTLTNFDTVKKSVERMKKLEDLLSKAYDETSGVKLNKKERLSLRKELDKLEANIGGIRTMRRLPEIIFVVDINKDDIAIKEAQRLHIPVVALIDTNCDPSLVNFPIPSNDDAPKVIKLFIDAAADAVIEGKQMFESRMQRQASVN